MGIPILIHVIGACTPTSLRRLNIRRDIFWLSALNLKDIPYHDDSHETLDRVHVQHVLSKGAFMLPPLSKIKVNFIYLGYKCNCWLKIVKHWDKRSEDKRDNGAM